MSNAIFIIAHAPLANALRQCVLHVFADAANSVVALDVPDDKPFDATVDEAGRALERLGDRDVLLVTDVIGATPCNVARRFILDRRRQLVSGANVAMLLRAVNYLHEPLEVLVSRALEGGHMGVTQVGADDASAAPRWQE